MRKLTLALVAVVGLLGAGGAWVAVKASGDASTARPFVPTDISEKGIIERGRYLATLGDCVACHTAKSGLMAGGYTIETPFGNLITPNITPDKETGIGDMTEQQFVRAMQDGIGKNGEHLYAAFPFTAYTKVTQEDIGAIYAYLKSLSPVHNKVEPNQMPFPFNIRMSLIGWNALFFKKGEYKPDSSQSVEWNRGAYLVQGLGHCVTCHSSKNFLGGDISDGYLKGYTLQGWVAPDITSASYKGIGHWSENDIVTYLRTGRNQYAAASGPMAEVVENSSYAFNDSDLKAIAVYLKSIAAPMQEPKAVEATSEKPLSKEAAVGSRIYKGTCAACHMDGGQGVPFLIPSLVKAGAVQADDPTTLINVILHGARAAGTDEAPTAPAMPALAWRLSDAQVANVATYVRQAWDNTAPAVSAGDVKRLRAKAIAKSE